MAELLIYNTTHWMDKLASPQWEEMRARYSNWDAKYMSRWQPGHVVEVQEDGFFTDPQTGRGWDRSAFRLLCISGMTAKEARAYAQPGRTELMRYRVTSGEGQEAATVTKGDLTVIDRDAA